MMGAPSHAKRHKRVKDATGGARCARLFARGGCVTVCVLMRDRGACTRGTGIGPRVRWLCGIELN